MTGDIGARRLGPAPLTDTVLVLAASLLAGWSFHRAFGTAALLPVIIPAVVVPATILLGTRLLGTRRLSRMPAVAVHVGHLAVVFLLAAALLFRPGHAGVPTGARWSTMVDGLLHGPAQLGTMTLPAPANAVLLVVPAALVWIATAAGTSLLGRGPFRLVALVPAGLTATGGVILGGPLPPGNAPVVVGIALCCTVLARSASPRWSTGQPMVRLLVVGELILAAVVAVPAGLWLADAPGPADRRPVEAHDLIAAPVSVLGGINPLDRVPAWLAEPQSALFTVDTDQPVDPAVWRLTGLDTFDGVRWSSSGRFTRAGLGVPRPRTGEAGCDDQASVVRQQIEITALDGPFLPAAGRPVTLDGGVTAVDAVDGTLLRGDDRASPFRYRVDAVCATSLRAPHPAKAAAGSEDQLRVPETLREPIEGLLRQTPGTGLDPYQRIVAVAKYLAEKSPNATNAGAGTSTGTLVRYLANQVQGGPVQLAEATAMAARQIGVPARLGVGFSPHDQGQPGPNGRRRYTITAGDAQVWAELRLAGVGWVAVAPSPSVVVVPARSSALGRDSQAPSSANPTGASPPGTSHPRWPGTSGSSSRHRAVLAGLVVGALLAAMVLAAYGVPAANRARRRRRNRRVGQCRLATASAWHDVLETAVRTGVINQSRLRQVTPRTTAVRLMEVDIDDPVGAELADLANWAVFDLARPVTTVEADRAWTAADRLRRRILRGQSRRQRISWMLRPPGWGLRPKWLDEPATCDLSPTGTTNQGSTRDQR